MRPHRWAIDKMTGRAHFTAGRSFLGFYEPGDGPGGGVGTGVETDVPGGQAPARSLGQFLGSLPSSRSDLNLHTHVNRGTSMPSRDGEVPYIR